MELPIILAFVVLAACFVIRVPIPFSLFIASFFYLFITGDDLGLISTAVMSSLYGNSTIVAIPLFIFLANIMSSGKVAEYMFSFVKAIFGRSRGAMAYTNILASLIFAGMSGSALADAAGIGLMEIEEMDRDGYDRPFSCAISAATGVVGPIFPPSVQMVIFAMLSGASVGSLFIGGVIPAIFICLTLAAYVWFISRKRNYPRGKSYTAKEFLSFTWKALPALMTPVILLVCIYTGIVTATESGVLASFYAIIIAVIVYRIMGLKEFLEAVRKTVVQSSVVIATLMSVYALNLIIVKSGLGTTVANFVLGMTDNKYVFMLVVNLVFLICGMVIPGEIPTYVIIPMLLPAVSALGINMIHFGIVVTINLIFGLVTPPYGMLCFVISGAAKEPLSGIFREIIPMAVILFLDLLILMFVPQLCTWLPGLM